MSNILETLKTLGPARLGIMGAILFALLIFFIFISVRISTPNMTLLYADLSSVDAGAVAAKLEETKIKYKMSSSGKKIMVSENDVGRARMLLADAGLPNGGSMGYEIFDKKSSFGTTTFEQNINQVRALEGELSRTIASLNSIKKARVHLVLPQREIFSRQSRPASASVVIDINSGYHMDRTQVASIQALVANAVPRLKSEKVSIIDSDNNLLANGKTDSEQLLPLKAEEMKLGIESRMITSIEDIVGKIVGYGKVRAQVNAEVNFDRISTNEELYDPEGQVLRSTQTIEESNSEKEPFAQDVSVKNNLPGIGGDLLLDDSPTSKSNRIEETANFEISKTIRSTIREIGEINRLTVAVVIDGKYITDENGEKTYVPRKPLELEQISKLIKSSIGFDDTRGDEIEVINMQFATIDMGDPDADKILGFEPDALKETIEMLVIAFVILLVVILVIQPMVGRILETSESFSSGDNDAKMLLESNETQALEAPHAPAKVESAQNEEESDALIDMNAVEGKVRASTVKKVEDIVESYPNETVSVIRSWMSQEQ